MNTDKNLKQLLSTWEVDVPIPRRFQAEVWAKIAAQEGRSRSLWDRLRDGLSFDFYRPQFAAVVVTLGLMLGIGAGYVNAQNSNALVGRQLEARYMQTINPLAHAGHSS